MAKHYHLHLKGYVGGWDFDSDYVDYILNKFEGKEVNVLIDSLGGLANTALSIYAAFKRHGNVKVHFVGMNASAATIASLSAKHITIDKSAMYLVHKCNIGFFEWGTKNADDLQTLIDKIEHQKKDLDKLDANVAQIYAARCKKEPSELLNLMKEGSWLTATEAKEWGFVDEITDFEEEAAPVMTADLAHAMANAGIPVPEQMQKKSLLKSISNFFKSSSNIKPQKSMKKFWTLICGILACQELTVSEEKITMEEAQMDAIEAAIAADKKTINDLNTQISSLQEENKTLKAQVESLNKKPAEKTTTVVETKVEKEKSIVAEFADKVNAAHALFNEIS